MNARRKEGITLEIQDGYVLSKHDLRTTLDRQRNNQTEHCSKQSMLKKEVVTNAVIFLKKFHHKRLLERHPM